MIVGINIVSFHNINIITILDQINAASLKNK